MVFPADILTKRYLTGLGTMTRIEKVKEKRDWIKIAETEKEILKVILERRKKIIEKGQFRIALINKEIQEYQAMMIEKKEEIKDIAESKNVILYELYKIKRF